MSTQDSFQVPAVSSQTPSASDGAPECVPIPEPGSYVRLTPEFDEDAQSRAAREHQRTLDRHARRRLAREAGSGGGESDDDAAGEHGDAATDDDLTETEDADDVEDDADDEVATDDEDDTELEYDDEELDAGEELAYDDEIVDDEEEELVGDEAPAQVPAVAGTVLLVSEVRYAEGAFHSAVIAAHPTGKVRGMVVTAQQFRRWFEPAPDWETVRAKELADAQSGVHESEERMARGPERTEVDPEPNAPMQALPSGGSAIFSLAVQQGARDAIERTVTRRIEIATRTERWLRDAAGELQQRVGLIAAFHQERAQARIAQTQLVREEVRRLQTGVESLGIYAGADVDVVTIVEGASARPDVPLFLLQRRLFMDEEFLINVALGGADWEDMDAFRSALQTDERLRRALVPLERCVVLFEIRRTDKEYAKDIRYTDPAAWVQINTDASAANHARFLLVRDGERLSQVWLPDAIGSAERLFPQRDELDKPFQGYDGTRLTFDDLKYFEAARKAENEALFYKRLLVLLWGLNDRLSLFGPFYEPERYPASGFLSLDFQHERMVFVHDDDARAFDDGRARWATWLPRMNAYLQPGSRVLCMWDRLLDTRTAPSIVKWTGTGDHRYEMRHAEPIEPLSIAVCSTDADGHPIVKVKARQRFGSSARVTEARVNLAESSTFAPWSGRQGENPGYLVLDAVRAEDIEEVLEGRADREQYMDYVPLLTAARDAVREQEALSERARLQLAAEIVAAGLADQTQAGVVAREAARTWRSAHRGEAPPDPRTPRGKKALVEMRAVAWAQLRDVGADAVAVEALVRGEGREPLALVARGDGRLAVYAEGTAVERHDDIVPWRWASRAYLRYDGSTLVRDGEWEPATLPVATTAERLIRGWPGAAARRSRPFTYAPRSSYYSGSRLILEDPVLSLDRAAQLAEAVRDGGRLLHSWTTGEIDVAGALAEAERLIRQRGGWHTRMESTPVLVIPIAVLEVTEPYREPVADFMTVGLSTGREIDERLEASRCRRRERAAMTGHNVLAVAWDPYAALLGAGGAAAEAVEAFWKRFGYPNQVDRLRGRRAFITRFAMDGVPLGRFGIVQEKPTTYERYGPQHLAGSFEFFERSSNSRSAEPYVGKVAFLSDEAFAIVKKLVAPVKPDSDE